MISPRRERFGAPPRPPHGPPPREPLAGPGDRWALWLLFGVHVVLEAALAVAAWTLVKYLPNMPLTAWQKAMFEIGIAAALVAFGVRAVLVLRRLRRTRSA